MPAAKALRLGERKRIEHDCGPGRVLLVSSTTEGLKAWCFRCNDRGWEAPPAQSMTDRLAALRSRGLADEAAKDAALPEPGLPWSEWPAQHRLWLLRAGLGAADAGRLGAYYHPPTDRVVLPVLEGSSPVFWQARAVDGRVPKYLSPEKPAGGVLPRFGIGTAITLTEDLLSAYKVGSTEGCEGWSLMGTSLKPHVLGAILKDGRQVNVWLDPDDAGQRACRKVSATLRGMGVDCKIIQSTKDPKLLHRATIKELLWPTSK